MIRQWDADTSTAIRYHQHPVSYHCAAAGITYITPRGAADVSQPSHDANAG